MRLRLVRSVRRIGRMPRGCAGRKLNTVTHTRWAIDRVVAAMRAPDRVRRSPLLCWYHTFRLMPVGTPVPVPLGAGPRRQRPPKDDEDGLPDSSPRSRRRDRPSVLSWINPAQAIVPGGGRRSREAGPRGPIVGSRSGLSQPAPFVMDPTPGIGEITGRHDLAKGREQRSEPARIASCATISPFRPMINEFGDRSGRSPGRESRGTHGSTYWRSRGSG